MAREKTIEVAALNIAAHPHPPGIYLELLTKASEFLIRVRGHDYAKITLPKVSEDENLVAGRILIWTEIDLTGPWLDLRREEALDRSLKAAIQIPDGAKPNYRAFNYLFDVRRHRLYFEIRNEFRETLSPQTARRFFENLLSREIIGLESPEVEVTVVPDTGAVERILSLPKLRTLEITVVLPNPDDDDEAEERILRHLERNGARRSTTSYYKQSDVASLTPTQDVIDEAKVAAANGEVRGVGRENGRRTELSTAQLPKKVAVSLDAGVNFVSRLLARGLF